MDDADYERDLIQRILDWSDENPEFDPSFVYSLQEQLEADRELSPAQIRALRNIINGWDIP